MLLPLPCSPTHPLRPVLPPEPSLQVLFVFHLWLIAEILRNRSDSALYPNQPCSLESIPVWLSASLLLRVGGRPGGQERSRHTSLPLPTPVLGPPPCGWISRSSSAGLQAARGIFLHLLEHVRLCPAHWWLLGKISHQAPGKYFFSSRSYNEHDPKQADTS